MTSQEVKLLLLLLDFGERVIVKTAHILWIKSVFMSIPDIFKLRCKKNIYIILQVILFYSLIFHFSLLMLLSNSNKKFLV